VVYAGGNWIATVFRLLGGFLATRLVTPSVLGLLQSFTLVVQYLPLLSLGVFEGFERQVPFYRGKQDHESVNRVIGTAQAWAVGLGGASVLFFGGLALWALVRGQWAYAAGWVTVAALAFCVFFSVGYLETLYRTHHGFGRLSKVYVFRAVVGLVLVLAVWAVGFYGLCLRSLGLYLAGVWALWRWRPSRIRPQWNLGEWASLMAVGLPIMAVTRISSLWFVVNRTLILQLLGQRELGLYALTPMMYPALNLLPVAVAHVVYPRVNEIYGREGDFRQVVRYALRPIMLLTVCMIPVVAGIWLLLPTVVRILLPKYIEGVSAARWALFDVFILCLMQIRMVFFAAKRQYLYLSGIVVGILVYTAALVWFLWDSMCLEDFPKAMLVGRISNIIVCYAILVVLYWRGGAEESAAGSGE